jgi:hypothetical protein
MSAQLITAESNVTFHSIHEGRLTGREGKCG